MRSTFARCLSGRDAMLWSVVNEAGVELFLSEDLQHERVLGVVRFRNPFLVADPFIVAGEQPAKDA
ncbi:MAG: PIN domain-containing protein [bacterium]|nr:PIN domain-containing protein [bacterium]